MMVRILQVVSVFLLLGMTSYATAQTIVLRGTVVTMTSEQAVLNNGVVVIENDQIIEVRPGLRDDQYPGAQIIDLDGYIFPGLIDIHNHTLFNATLPVETDPVYQNRYQWQPDGNGVDLTPFIGSNPPLPFNSGYSPFNREVFYPMHLLTNSTLAGLAVEVSKYAEIKALTGGTTTIEGSIDHPAVTNILVRNAEHENFGQDRVCRTVAAVTSPEFQGFAANVRAQATSGLIDACLIHLAEGTDADSLAEFDVLKQEGMLEDWTVIVHGVPFGESEFSEMAAVGADLVWSPTSNLVLYGQDARADLANHMGVNVSLGSDWSVSGDKNLLAGLKVAWALNEERHRLRRDFEPRYRKFSAFELVRMVTVNPAASLGWGDRVGRLEAGFEADIMVVDKIGSDPYQSLIDAGEANVQLVMVGGDALYGDETVVSELKGSDYELIVSGNYAKAIDVTKAGVPQGSQTFAELQDTLTGAMQFNIFQMFATYPIVTIVGSLVGAPISITDFAYLFALVFFDFLPEGTPFPPPPAAIGFLFTPGAMSTELAPAVEY